MASYDLHTAGLSGTEIQLFEIEYRITVCRSVSPMLAAIQETGE
jgi:hypothetical protein